MVACTASEVIDFWRDAGPAQWFAHSPDFDERFRTRFLEAHFAAARRELDAWAGRAEGSLALLILLDQFPRNAFRGTGHMFATDPLARLFARHALAAGHAQAVEPDLRVFMLLPFMHSEQLEDQHLAVELHHSLGLASDVHALRHREVVQRFGRFPHRNPMLGRETTPEEADFLRDGGFAG